MLKRNRPRLLVATTIAVVALTASIMISAAEVRAQERATSVAVVEIQKIMSEALAARSIQDQIELRRGAYQEEISREESRLREMEQELTRQQSLLAPDAFAQRQREFQGQVAAVQRTVQERRRVLDRAYAEGVRRIQRELTAIIGTIAKERGIDIVVPTSQTLFAASDLSITDEALAKLNKSMAEITLQFPEN